MYKEYAEGAPVIPVTKNWFYGWAGSLKLGMYKDDKIVQIGSLSGITDEIKEKTQKLSDKVMEVSSRIYQEQAAESQANAEKQPEEDDDKEEKKSKKDKVKDADFEEK